MVDAGAAKQLPSPKFYLKVLVGPDQGFVFKIKKPKIFIGRGDDNDFVLNDPRSSRQHAMIEFTTKAIIIVDLDSSMGILLNGKRVKEGTLSPGSLVQIGDTQIKFEMRQAEASPVAVADHPLSSGVPESNYTSPPNESQGNPFFIILILALAGVTGLNYYKNKNGKSPGDEPTIRNDEAIQEEIDESKKRQDNLIRQQTVQGKQTQQYMEAQAAFVKGFRDYREGQYKRAMTSLSAALALYPEHELAQRYYQASQRKLDESVQLSLLEGKKYLEKNQYKMAASAYRNVMILLEDENNKNYQEARERYNEIQWILKGAF